MHIGSDDKKAENNNKIDDFDKIIGSLLEVPPDHIKKPTSKKPKPHTKKTKK